MIEKDWEYLTHRYAFVATLPVLAFSIDIVNWRPFVILIQVGILQLTPASVVQYFIDAVLHQIGNRKVVFEHRLDHVQICAYRAVAPKRVWKSSVIAPWGRDGGHPRRILAKRIRLIGGRWPETRAILWNRTLWRRIVRRSTRRVLISLKQSSADLLQSVSNLSRHF